MPTDAVSKISQETIQKLKNKSIKGMATNPSEKGASAKQIQDAMTEPYIGDVLSLLTEINRIVTELNSKFVDNDEAIQQNQDDIQDAILEYREGISLLNDAVDLMNTILAGKQEVSNLYDGLDSDDATKYLSAKQGKVLKQLADGKKKAFNYANISTMVSALLELPSTSLKAGDDIYIVDTDVPDFWIKDVKSSSASYSYSNLSDFLETLNTNGYIQIGYYEIAKLETEKVDLSLYQLKGTFEVDTTTTRIRHTLKNYEEKSYRAGNISSVSIVIPSSIDIGFYSGVNFRIGNTVPDYFTTSISPVYTLKVINLGLVIDSLESFQPKPNTTIDMLFYCDGIYLYLYINEVS